MNKYEKVPYIGFNDLYYEIERALKKGYWDKKLLPYLKEYIKTNEELVERATPKKPITKKNSFDYYCPSCDVTALSWKFCPNCGQALDWRN